MAGRHGDNGAPVQNPAVMELQLDPGPAQTPFQRMEDCLAMGMGLKTNFVLKSRVQVTGIYIFFQGSAYPHKFTMSIR